jgi:hypothetical protein
MQKQYHIAVSETAKAFIQTTKANFSAPSATKESLEMSEREFVNALVALAEAEPKKLAKECERELSLRETRTRRSASLAEVEALQTKVNALADKLRAAGMDEAQIAEIIGQG